MCVAQGVNPGLLDFQTFPPFPSAANSGGGEGGGGHFFRPRADALRYTHAAPLGLKTDFSMTF